MSVRTKTKPRIRREMREVSAKDHVRQSQLRAVGKLELLAAAEGEEAEEAPRFRMLVNSGQRIASHYFWSNLYIDLDGINVERQSLPVLLDHDPDKRIGFTTSIRKTADGLVAEGFLLSTPLAQQVAQEARDGFPWECSCALPFSSVEEVMEGETTEVNGMTVTGPATVWRKTNLREVTFTAVGADQQTRAEVLAADAGGTTRVEIVRKENAAMAVRKKKGAAATDGATAAGVDDEHLSSNQLADGADGEDEDEDGEEMAEDDGESESSEDEDGEGDEDSSEASAEPAPKMSAKRSKLSARQREERARKVERERIAAIYRFAKPHQKRLAESLILKGVSVATAMQRLADDPDRDKDLRLARSEAITEAGPVAVPPTGEQRTNLGGSIVPASPRVLEEEEIANLWRQNSEVVPGMRARDIFFSASQFAAYKRAECYRWSDGRIAPRFDLSGDIPRSALLAGAASITSPRAFIGTFYERLESVDTGWIDRLATRVRSMQAQEVYRWLNQVPGLTEDTGNRKFEELGAESYTLVNKDWQGGIEVKVQDLRRDQTGQIAVRISELAIRAAEHPYELFVSLIANGAATTAHGAAYDGKAFFAGDHPIRAGGTNDNNIDADISTYPASVHGSATAPSPEEALFAMIAGADNIRQMKDSQGKLMNRSAKNFIVIGPDGTLGTALKAAAGSSLVGAGNTNPALLGNTDKFEVMTFPDLGFTDEFVVIRADSPIGAFIFQEELPTYLTVIGPGSEQEKLHSRHLYDARRTYNVGYGRYQSACLVNLV